MDDDDSDGPPPTPYRLARVARDAEIWGVYESIDPPPTFQSLTETLNALGMVISESTVGRVIREGQRLNRRNMPRLYLRNDEARWLWCMAHGVHRESFNRLVFSDEKRFEIERQHRGSRFVWIRDGAPRMDPRRIRTTSGQNTIKLMAFGIFVCDGEEPGYGDLCFVPSGASGTVNAENYAKLLRGFIAFHMKRIGPYHLLLEDNASSHAACATLAMPFERVNQGTYPAHSPDYNAIERMWAITQSKVLATVDTWSLKDRNTIPLLRMLIRDTFVKLCRSPVSIAAVNSTWENLNYGAMNGGRQRPG